MKKYRKTTTLTSRGLYLRKRIARNRGRAKFIGFLYLLATMALTAAVVWFPLLTHDMVSLEITKFWEIFKPATLKTLRLSNTDLLYQVVVTGLYALMLFGLVINALRALGKLGWLFKKSANKSYGFNRNVYAMEDLGKIFSGSYVLVFFTYFLIAIMCKNWNGTSCQIDKFKFLAVLGGGIFAHFFCGIVGAKVRYYDFDQQGIVEATRVVGRFAPFFRNLLQLACVGALMYFYLKITTLNTIIPNLLSKSGLEAFIKDMPGLIDAAAQVALILCLFVLAKHATATTEYNFDGVHGSGMKNFRVFAFFTFLIAGGVIGYGYLMVKDYEHDANMLYVGAIAFAMFVVELLMRKMPKFPTDKKSREFEEEFSIEEISFPQEQEQAQTQTQIQKVDQSF